MGILNEKVSERRSELIHELKIANVASAKSGLPLESVSLADLEWMNVIAKNKAARSYGERL